MLTIRKLQLGALGKHVREQFVGDMLDHLYSHFPAVAWLLTPDELRCQVNITIDCAAVYQLTSQQQVCRFINLAATYGWGFDRNPDLSWMRSILVDTDLTLSGDRLDRLVQTCLHRQTVEAHNQVLRQRLGAASVKTSAKPELELAEVDSAEKIMTSNPLSYRRSQILGNCLEAVPITPPSLSAPAWVKNTSELLRNKSGGRHDFGK